MKTFRMLDPVHDGADLYYIIATKNSYGGTVIIYYSSDPNASLDYCGITYLSRIILND